MSRNLTITSDKAIKSVIVDLDDYKAPYVAEGYATGYAAGVASVVSKTFSETISFDAGSQFTYKKIIIGEDRGVWTFGALTNVTTYKTSLNGAAYQTNLATLTLVSGDVVEIYITKTNAANASSIAVSGTYSLNSPISPNYGVRNKVVNSKITYLDDWMVSMYNSYQSLHNTQLDDEDMIEEFLNRLQPHYILLNVGGGTNATGYAYTTFGPAGLNKSICDFVYMCRMKGKKFAGSTAFRMSNSTKINIDGYNSTATGTGGTDNYKHPTGSNFYISFYGTNLLKNLIAINSVYTFASKLPTMDVDNGGSYDNITVNCGYGNLSAKLNSGASTVISSTGITGTFNFNQTTATQIVFSENVFLSATSRKWIFPANTTSINGSNNCFDVTAIDTILNNIRLRVDEITPTANIAINLTGSQNAAPTGGVNNVDRLAIIAKYSGAGRTATITTS